MSPDSVDKAVLSFGPYEADLTAGELRKNGIRLKLQDQPFQVLTALLERPGELVTREELRQRLWADDTFVDFDNALNTAVNKIREALDDSARQPQFVETVPRRGYRWIGPAPSPGAYEEPVEPAQQARIRWYAAAAAAAIAYIAVSLGVGYRGGPFDLPPAQPLKAVPLTSYEGSEATPSFSPDGNQVAFSWNGESSDNFDIYVRVIGSGAPLRLTKDPAMDTAPAWSPDGRYIAFIRSTGPSGEGAVYLIPPLGGEERKLAEGVYLLKHHSWVAKLSWTPDSRFLYLAEWVGLGQSIFRIDLKTGEKHRVTSPQPPGDYAATVSPDGKNLAFSRAMGIYVTPIHGGDPRRIASVIPATSLAWMPDGREIVFVSRETWGYTPRLWRISVDGGSPKPVSIPGEGITLPAVSPARNRLIYEHRRLGSNIWRYDRTEREGEPWRPTKIIASTLREANPQISPDGKRIVFASQRTGIYQAWLAASDGSNQAQLTSLSASAGSPRWAPDGETIVFDAMTDHGSNLVDIFVIHSKEGAPRPVVVEKGMQGRPSWSQDGRWIYYFSDQTGVNQIWKAPAGGGEPVQLTRKGGYHPFESPDGKYVYYASEREESTIRRVPVDGGEEADILTGVKKAGYGYWDVTREGIYFIDEVPNEDAESHWVLKLYDFETKRISVITNLDQPPFASTVLDVSPDGNWFVYAQMDRNDSDLMLVEDFQ